MPSNSETASRPAQRRSFWKPVVLVTLSAATIYALFALDLIDAARVRSAFREHAGLLALDVLCLLGVTVIASIRHKLMLSVFLHVSWRKVLAANVLSQAVGQWAPGSMAVGEAVRIGLLLGGTDSSGNRGLLVSQVAIASLIDRVFGLGVMFCAAAAAALTTALLDDYPAPTSAALFALTGVTSLLGLGLVALPLCADTRPVRALHAWLSRSRTGRLGGLLARIAALLDHLRGASQKLATHRRLLLGSFVLCFAGAALNPLGYYLTSLALGEPIPLLLLAAILPTTVASIILPIGFAGFGGPQLVAVAHFALFGVGAEAVLGMSVVQNALVLGLQTVLGIAWAVLHGGTLGSILRSGRSAETSDS